MDIKNIREWIPVVLLGCAAFILLTTEFLPVGLLSEISAAYGMSEAHTGIIITVYAATVAITAVPLTVLTTKLNRRGLIMVLLAIFVGGNVIAAAATTFSLLVGARIIIALTHALFWSITIPLSMRIAPEGKAVQGLGVVVTSTSLATVFGVPIGTYIGFLFSWRDAFLMVAIIAIGILLLMYRFMPSEPSAHTGSFRSLPTLLRRPSLIVIYLIIILGLAGSYTAYSYFSPFMQNVGYTTDAIAVLLLVYGIAGVLGNVLGTKNTERHPTASLVLPLVGLTIGLGLLFPATGTLAGTVIVCLLWGTAVGALSFSVNREVLRRAPDATDVAASLSNVSFNIGVACGSFFGGVVYASTGVENIGVAGAGVAGITVIIALGSLLIKRKSVDANIPEKTG